MIRKGGVMMPKFVCRKCHSVFWGWGIHYEYISGKKVECPECKGALVLQNEKQTAKDSGKKVLKTSSAA